MNRYFKMIRVSSMVSVWFGRVVLIVDWGMIILVVLV